MPATPTSSTDVVTRLFERTNTHDIDGLVACFADDYVLTNPVHPARSFAGKETVRANWTALFAGIPDVAVEMQRQSTSGADVWTEVAMTGTRRDGGHHDLRGVMIFTVRDGLIRAMTFYCEPVQGGGVDNAQAVGAAAGARQ